MEFAGVVPFASLAAAIRNKPQREVAEVLRAVSELAINIHDIKSVPIVTMCRRIRALRQRIDEWSTRRTLHRTRSNRSVRHTLAELPHDGLFMFLEENVMRIVGDPRTIVVETQGITTAEMWLIACVIHREVDPSRSIYNLIRPYISEQPRYEPSISAFQYFDRIREMGYRSRAVEPHIPGLDYSLNHFGIVEDIRSMTCLIIVYFRLGVTAAMLRVHLALAHDISPGDQVPVNHPHLTDILERVDRSFALHVSSWHHHDPLATRQELAHLNAGGIFLYFFNHVLPNVLCRDEPMPASHMAWEMCRYIAAGAVQFFATKFSRDSHQRNLQHLVEFFSLMDLIDTEHPVHDYNFVAPYFEFDFEPFTDDGDDIEVEPYGAPIDVYDYAVRESNPPGASLCTICQEMFSSGFDSDQEESLCVKLSCDHLFHFECIKGWLNASHISEVVCPNCRMSICFARPRRAVGLTSWF